MPELNEKRIAMIPALAERSAAGHIGRTALMKYLYFLQTLRKVPLGYRFTLYSYGPFDSEVLADLSNAENLGIVESEPVLFPGGYGYEIRPALRSNWIKKRVSGFLKEYKSDIKWVSKTFGNLKSAELELVSTIVYVDREAAQQRKKVTVKELSSRVHEVKPHFASINIEAFAKDLLKGKLLRATK